MATVAVAVAAASVALSVSPATLRVSIGCRRTRTPHVRKQMNQIKPIVGGRVYNKIMALGVPVSPNLAFANMVIALMGSRKRAGRRGVGGGGALFATCNAGDEIFRIAAIMNALVLIGVAVGFVLLRIEAFVEEADES
ncbi:hypothetical protein Dimus_025615 [Dionaea muscipula]